MSKAFTRESDDAPDLSLPIERAAALPIGARNYLTQAGAQRLRDELIHLAEVQRPQLAVSIEAEAKGQLAAIDVRIAHLEASLQSAEIVAPDTDRETVRFGAAVTVREGGEQSVYRIVGVDEADPDRGWVSWQSPIAKALLNGRRGESVRFKLPSGEAQLEIVEIDYEE